jgi:Domain of unknown function (DUF4347)
MFLTMLATSNRTCSGVALAIVPHALVAIDRQITDFELLAAGVIPGTEVVLLDRDGDGIEQITAALKGRKLTSLHLVSHGAPGQVWLGNAILSVETLDRDAERL